MPPPCLPRHLRPCRPRWSAHQLRFASDRPSTAGGDAPQRASSARQRNLAGDDVSLGSSLGQETIPESEFTVRRVGVQSRDARWRRVFPTAQPPDSTRSSSSSVKSQAQRIKEALDANGTKLRLERQTPLAAKESAPVTDAIAATLEKKVQLEEQRPSEAPKETEEELRAKLKDIEEQLALLQKKLEAGKTAEPVAQTQLAGQSLGGTGIADDQPPAVNVEDAGSSTKRPTRDRKGTAVDKPVRPHTHKMDNNAPAQQMPAQPSSMRPSSHRLSARPASQPPSTASDGVSEQSLLDELFPEASSQVQRAPQDRRPSPPKLDLPAPDTNPHIRLTLSDTRTDKEKAIDAFRKSGEQTTILQLSNCSTALTEADFRRLIPRGQHIESWSRDGEFYKIIPGRDPLSLERLPFYYLLFHTPASALAYQKNAARLSKLSALHAPNGIHSAIPPPTGFLENGEDIHAATRSFVLHPDGHKLDLRTVMQPYNHALRSLIDAGGYSPIVPNTDAQGKKIHRVLMHIDGYEPSQWDLWQILSRHAHAHGIMWPFYNDHASAVRRLRETINLRTVSKAKYQATASANPRAATRSDRVEYEDPQLDAFLSNRSSHGSSSDDDDDAKQINQLVMNRVYNRWIVEFEDEDAARRFAIMWHRVVLPDAKEKTGAWRDGEEVRWVGAEYLW
ncbi:uncharacterized protein EKO05_0004626 [Ascochyta rabiei]|uniref:Uncharacterized protein n=1 Tax=Didymella rabiei TaxID=5454 RepID=A0A163EZG6_DIDRA|nr:uncharacterized protein EKO05_0004626 [Ascochyta rabiei]KZM24036.1 hypothetical protein ST47_g4794 [Ascochyta rabiei]UPX14135.1 hypothetical protein EKO05_0004626 [Ascochyta rabiei]